MSESFETVWKHLGDSPHECCLLTAQGETTSSLLPSLSSKPGVGLKAKESQLDGLSTNVLVIEYKGLWFTTVLTVFYNTDTSLTGIAMTIKI